MVDKKCGVRLAASGLLALSLLAGTPVVHAGQAESAADSVRPPVESLGALRGAYEQAAEQMRRARSARGLSLPQGFVNTGGPNVLPPRLVTLAGSYAKRPTPKGAGGHPSLSGNWASQNAMIFGVAGTNTPHSSHEPVDLMLALQLADTRAAAAERLVPTNVPSYKAEHVAKVRELYRGRAQHDSSAKCGWVGVPRIGAPTQISESGNTIVFLYNDPNGASWRIIDMTRKAIPDDADSTYGGTSLGRWEGDTLVVEAQLFPDTWFGEYGYFHGPDMKVIEKFHRTGDIITYQVTVEDPSVLTKPWTRDAITLFRTGDAPAEPLRRFCTQPAADASNELTALFVTRQY